MPYANSIPLETDQFGPHEYLEFLSTIPAPNFNRLPRKDAIQAKGLVTRLGNLLVQLSQTIPSEAHLDDQSFPDNQAAQKTRATINKAMEAILKLTDRSLGTVTQEQSQEERITETQKLPWEDRINLSINAARTALQLEVKKKRESSELSISNLSRRGRTVTCDVEIKGQKGIPLKNQKKLIQEQFPTGTQVKLVTLRTEEEKDEEDYDADEKVLPKHKTSVVLAEIKSVNIERANDKDDDEGVLKMTLTLLEKGPVYANPKQDDEARLKLPDLTKIPKKYLEIFFDDAAGRSTITPPQETLLSGNFPKPRPVTETRKDLDESQNEAYGMAMNMEPVLFIHGPPGSGKTTTTCAIIEGHIAQGRKVLVLSHSNKGVNVPARMLKKRGITVFRAGNNLKKIDEALHRNRITRGVNFPRKELADIRDYVPTRRETRNDIGRVKDIKDDMRSAVMDTYGNKRAQAYDKVREAIKDGGVVFSTFGTLIGDEDLRKLKFDIVIIDEATKAQWPEFLDALKRAGKQIILVGDHRQLGPIDLTPTERVNIEGELTAAILHKETADFTGPPEERIRAITRARVAGVYCPTGIDLDRREAAKGEHSDKVRTLARLAVNMHEAGPLTSILEGCRDPEQELPYVFLEKDRRSLPNIVRVLSHLIYKDKLLPGREAREGEHQGIVQWIDTSFIETRESTVGTSRRNAKEANVVVNRVLNKLFNPDKSKRVAPEDIAVIATYAEQAALIRRKLARKLHNNQDLLKRIEVNVASVDSFQGDERKVVFISMTRSNQAGSIGFLKEERRIGVAIGRAQDELYIIGDSMTLVNNNSNRESQKFFQKMKHAVVMTWGEMINVPHLTRGQRRAQIKRERTEHGLPNAPRKRGTIHLPKDVAAFAQ